MEVSLDTNGASPRRTDGACPLSESRRCPVCLEWRTPDRFPDITTCQHRSCADCLRRHLRTEISESRVDVSCPECPARFHPHDVREILTGGERALVERYEESRRRNEGFALRRCLAADPDCRWCPAPDCGYAVIAPGCGRCPKITCGREGCRTDFCYGCRRRWHPDQTCDVAVAGEAEERRAGDAKPCPRCASYISKTDGCDNGAP